MSEQSTEKSKATPDKAERGPSPKGTANEVEQAPVQVGRQQLGERVDGPVTTRAPRGVGEPASDTVGDDEGIRAAQEGAQKTVDEETAKGYRGEQADPTPNENYTVAGVTAGAPTPETTVFTPRGRS